MIAPTTSRLSASSPIEIQVATRAIESTSWRGHANSSRVTPPPISAAGSMLACCGTAIEQLAANLGVGAYLDRARGNMQITADLAIDADRFGVHH